MKSKIKKTIEYIKSHKKLKILSIGIISILSFFLVINLGRYVKTIIEDYITRTQRFYFNSDKLTVDNKQFKIDYWSGVESYPLTISVNSLDNNLRGTDIAIDYEIECVHNNDLRCVLSKENGTIGTTTNTDSFQVEIFPNKTFQDGDSASITVKASASYPYEKELSATFTFVVGSYGLTYKIEDEPGQPYLTAVVSNTNDHYTAIDDFRTYHYGDPISQELYDTLTAEEKEKCASAVLTMSFNPNVLRLDMTNYYYQNKLSEVTQPIGGYDYVNSFTFAVASQTSVAIKFYKLTVSDNHTYPLGTDINPIVTLTET